jgi:hypothetical protein
MLSRKILVKTIPGMGEREMKEHDEGAEFKYNILDLL